MMKNRLALVLVLSVALASVGHTAPPVVSFKIVAHPSVPVASLTRGAASSAFLKKTEKWPDGTAIVPVDLAHDAPLKETFCREIHNKSVAMVDAFWQKQVFSGRATPPLTKRSDTEVIAYVRAVSGAIGYVSASTDSTGLKEIRLE